MVWDFFFFPMLLFLSQERMTKKGEKAEVSSPRHLKKAELPTSQAVVG